MVNVPMPRGNPIDEKYKDLRSALDIARRAVVEANKKESGVPSENVLELRHRAYRAWQELESFLRDQKIIADDAHAPS
jgi:hypothetical protein